MVRKPSRWDKLPRYVVLLLVALAAWNYLVPWLQQRSGSPAVSDEESEASLAVQDCLSQSRRAVEDLREKLANLSVTSVEVDWIESMRMNRAEVERARRACSCEVTACDLASSALGKLSEARGSWEATLRAGSRPQGVERVLGEVDAALERARAATAEQP